MGRTTIVPENRVSTETERFPALRFQAKDERARIACLERQQLPDGRNVLTPWMEFVHRIERPLEKDGVPLQKKLTRKGRDGQETTEMVWDTDWVSSPICLGDKAVLMEKGLDVGNCPVCRASEDNPEITAHRGLGSPVVRYAMNVVRFSIRPGGFILAEPFGAQIVVWSFTEKRFNRLDDLNRKLAERGEVQFRRPDGSVGARPYDITDVDLLLGPCEDVGWQRFDIDLAEGLAMWRRSQPTAQYIQQLWLGAGMRATDEQLQLACGKPVTNRAYLDEDIFKAVSGWHKALRGGPAPTVDPFGASFGGQQAAQDMTAGMGAMVDELATPPVPMPPQPQMGVPQVSQPSVPAAPAPTVQPQFVPPAVPQVPQVPQPSVQPTPAGPPPPVAQAQPLQAMPPAPPTAAQMNAAAGPPGLEQFAPSQNYLDQYAPQAPAPASPGWEMGAVPPTVPLSPAPAPMQAVPGAVPVSPQATVSATAPAPPAPDLFAPQVPSPAPEGAAVEFDALANF